MKKAIVPILILCILPMAVLFESLFLDASLMSFDNRIFPPFCYHFSEGDLPRVMNTASCDINAWLMPETLLHIDRMKTLDAPLWNECEHFGQPLLAMLGFTPFYPSSPLYLLLGPLRGFAVSMGVHLLILGLGMFFFLLRNKLAPSGALLGAMTLSLCAFITVHLHIPIFVQAAVWLPWILIAADRLIERPRVRRAAILGLLIGLSLLGGFPQLSIFIFGVTALWFLVRLFHHESERKPKAVTLGALAVLLGGLIACVQLIPASETLSESTRSEGWSSDVLAEKRFAPQSLVGLALPRFFGPGTQEFTEDDLIMRLIFDFPSVKKWQVVESQNGFEENAVFMGLIPLVLALTSFFRKWRLRELFPRLLLIASMLYCMGLFFISDWCENIPGVSTGSPKRMLFVFSFALAWLAALEFDRLRKEGHGVWLIPFGTFFLAVGIVGFLPCEKWFFPEFSSEDQAWFRETINPDLFNALAAGLILVVCGLALRRAHLGLLMALLLAGTAGELVMFGRYPNPPQRLDSFYETTPVIDWIKERGVDRDKRYIAFNSSEVLPVSIVQVFGLRSLNGMLSMLDRQTHELLTAMEPDIVDLKAPGLTAAFKELGSLQSPILDMLGVHYIVTGILGYNQITAALENLPGIELAYTNTKEGLALFKRSGALPHAHAVQNLRVIPDKEERLAYLVSDAFDPSKEVVVGERVEGFPNDDGEPADATDNDASYSRPSPERIEIDLVCESPAFLVIAESNFPGWHAEVNGKEVPIIDANHAVMGVPVPQGANRVVLTYRPQSFFTGVGLSLLGILICAIVLSRN